MYNIVGFETPSKKLAIAEVEGKNKPQQEGEKVISIDGVRNDTYERLQALGETIMSSEFANFPPEVKQIMLFDFAYYKNVADVL